MYVFVVGSGLAVGAALGDRNKEGLHHPLLRVPDIFSFVPGNPEYTAFEKVCRENGIDLQEAIKDGNARFVTFSHGIYDRMGSTLKFDYEMKVGKKILEVLRRHSCCRRAQKSTLMTILQIMNSLSLIFLKKVSPMVEHFL